MRVVAAVLTSLSLLIPGCGGEGSNPPTIEEQAWIAAGVERPDFQRVERADGTALVARVETRLPVDEVEDDGRRFADRVAQIIWRTYAGPFDVIELTVLHDGRQVVTADPGHRDLELRLGPRPESLDDGVARSNPPPVRDGPFVDIGSPPDLGDVQARVFEPILDRTLEEFFDHPDSTVEHGEPEECLGGLTGEEPTGEFKATSDVPTVPAAQALAVLPVLTDYWRRLGLDVDTSVFDGGLNSVQVDFDGLGVLSARAIDQGVSLRGTTRCLDPE